MVIITKEGKLQEGIEITANEQEIFEELQDVVKEYPYSVYSSNATKLAALLIEKYKMYKREEVSTQTAVPEDWSPVGLDE